MLKDRLRLPKFDAVPVPDIKQNRNNYTFTHIPKWARWARVDKCGHVSSWHKTLASLMRASKRARRAARIAFQALNARGIDPDPSTPGPAPSIDALVQRYTVAGTLDELCDLGSDTGYRPSIYTRGSPDKTRLADAYDARQAERGDSRRAYRG